MNSLLKYTFTDIFDNRKWGFRWGNETTYSGPGSTQHYTENLRRELPKIYEKFNITSVLDAPCGDLNWMNLVINKCKTVDYIGGDIVKSLIDKNTERFGRSGVKFIELDITSNKLPSVDLMICRDCLFHLHKEEIFNFIDNFVNSDIKYLLTSTYTEYNTNVDISVGRFFKINLFESPYNFPEKPLYKIDDWVPGFPIKEMYLWDRDQIIAARNSANK